MGWERKLLQTLENPGLPSERDYFADDLYEYLVVEIPTGQSLWDAWDDPDSNAAERFGRLAELARILQRLHQCNAMVEGLCPDIVVIDDAGQVRLNDLGDLLPIPLPGHAPIRGSLYTRRSCSPVLVMPVPTCTVSARCSTPCTSDANSTTHRL